MILKKLDGLRKKIMPKLTGNIGKSHFERKVKGTQKAKIEHILICRPNQRLGNMLLLTPLIQEIIALFPDCKIDIIVKGTVAKVVFQEYKHIDTIIVLPRKPFKELIKYLRIFFSVKFKKYDLVINGDKGSSSGKILTYLSNSKYKIFDKLEGQASVIDDMHMAKNSVYNFRDYMSQIGYLSKLKSVPNLDLKLTNEEILEGKEILKNTVINPNLKTISIFTFATGAKCHSKTWWHSFYEKLKSKTNESYNVLEILPFENVSQIDFNATTFYSKYIREIASVIANTELFIGGDSGIMHLASASKTDTLGLFSVTNPKIYMPYNNKSTFIDTNLVDIDKCVDIVNENLKNGHSMKQTLISRHEISLI